MSDNKSTILIIDDDAFLLDMYALKFTQKEYAVTAKPGTIEALEFLRSGNTPDIILVDLVLPIMDGFEFLETINKEGLASDSVKIILSNLGQEDDIERGMKLGASGYIVKASATPSEVVQKVGDIRTQKKS
jgi:CheY-like chemotaxis protein